MQFWIAPLNFETPLRGEPPPGCRVGQSSPLQCAGYFHAHDFILSCVLRGGWRCWSQLWMGKLRFHG